MGNKPKFDDPIGFLYCRYCEELKPLDSKNFYKNQHTSHGFMIYCKVCDDKKRTDRWLSLTSHTVKLNCLYCEKEFWAEKNRVRAGRNKYCSKKCSGKANGAHLAIYNNGEANPRSRLTENDVREIRKMKDDGVKKKIILDKFNIKSSHFYNIINGRIWKHVV